MRAFKMRDEQGIFVKHVPCPACRAKGEDRAGDNLALYRKPDGSLDGTCMKCKTFFKEDELEDIDEEQVPAMIHDEIQKYDDDVLTRCKSIEIKDRRIAQKYTEKYGVVSLVHNGTEKDRYYPVYKDGKLVGHKHRILPKTFAASVGNTGGDIELFGQHLFKAGGKLLIITAGEEDAMASYAMTEYKSPAKRGYASVSLPNGAGDGKSIKNNLEWISSFEKVVFAVDQEELDLGKAEEYCSLLPPGKGFIARFSEKDASDMCREGKFTEFYNAVWEAKEYAPSGIIEGNEIWKEYKKKDSYETIAFPESWGINDFNYGLYYPSLCTLTAGTGVGKSTLLKEMQYHLFENTKYNIGVISLEEPLHLCAGVLMGMYLNKRIMLPDVEVTEKEEKDACKALFGSGRFVFCENAGIRTPEDLMNKIRFMANARDCKVIFLDHLTAVVNKFPGHGAKNDYVERIVNGLNDLCQELNICIMMVSHVRKTSGDSDETYETGKVPTEDSMFGSSSIKQYSYLTLAISRNKSDENSPLFVHVLKDRLSGRTGKSVPLFYDEVTGRISRIK